MQQHTITQLISAKKSIGLYIHIPFCTVLCPFCDFYKKSWTKDYESQFIEALLKEIDTYRFHEKIKIKSIYFGGGTPSILPNESFKKIILAIRQTFKFTKNIEITLEANPEDITHNKLTFWKQIGFNRISLGVQSFNEAELQFLGRGHSVKQNHLACEKINAHSNWNLSIDLMFGLRNSTIESTRHSLRQILNYQPTHISTYALTIEPNTIFYKQKIKNIPADKELAQYKEIIKSCESKKFRQYEVSSFAKKGFKGKHNSNYWEFGNFIGLGPGAHSFLNPYRYTNKKNLTQYINNPTPYIFETNCHPLSEEILLVEHIIANLRQRKGLAINNINQIYHINFLKKYKSTLTLLKKEKYISLSSTHCKTTKKGLYVLNSIAECFLTT